MYLRPFLVHAVSRTSDTVVCIPEILASKDKRLFKR